MKHLQSKYGRFRTSGSRESCRVATKLVSLGIGCWSTYLWTCQSLIWWLDEEYVIHFLCNVLKLNDKLVDGKRFNQNWHPPVRLDKNGKAETRWLVITMKGEGRVLVEYCLSEGGDGMHLALCKSLGTILPSVFTEDCRSCVKTWGSIWGKGIW